MRSLWAYSRWVGLGVWGRRGEERNIQQTDSKDGQDADFAPGWDFELRDTVEREEED